MKFKILADFQENNQFYQKNVYEMDWKFVSYVEEDDHNKFHYFKFIKIDKSKDLSDDHYIFPIFYQAAETQFLNQTDNNAIIDFINGNKDLFVDKKLIPVFLDPLEGNHGFKEPLDKFSEMYPDIDFYFINGDYALTQTENKFRFKFNDQWIHHVEPLDKPINYRPKKTYINLNRVARFHRCMLMDTLINKKLLKSGFNTWANTYGAFDEYKEQYPKTKIEKTVFETLDVHDVTKSNPTLKVPIEHCTSSMFYIVTETHFDNEVLFLSEKTYKPISIGMPFMSLGNPGTLNYLHELGFQTFSKWIDETYDLDLPLQERINIIAKNINMLNNLSNVDKIYMRRDMEKVCKHNLETYKTLQRKNTLIKIFYDILEEAK